MSNLDNSPQHIAIPRRAFLMLAGEGLALAALGGLVKVVGEKGKWARPPGTVDEPHLISLCLKCQKCVEICPTQVITPVSVFQDVEKAGTPWLNFRLGYCNLCMKCTQVCPTGALRKISQSAVAIGTAEVDQNRCVAWAWGGCQKCYDKCPYQAITLDDHKRPVVDRVRCNGCGLCEYICPSASLRAYTLSSGKGIVIAPRLESVM